MISDIDECANGTHDCHRDAICTNTDGGFNCSCNGGFTGDGRKCAGVECILPKNTTLRIFNTSRICLLGGAQYIVL